MAEQRFENRMVGILQRAAWVVINCARSKPFDIIAFNRKYVYMVELKPRNRRADPKQLEMQGRLMNLCPGNACNVLVQQSRKKRGKITISGDHFAIETMSLTSALKRMIEE